MKQISKDFPTLGKAQKFMESLYRKYNYVRLSVFPRFSESGEYVFTVEWIMRSTKLDKLVASNTLNANHNIMSSLDKNSVQYICLQMECERIIKRYPSLA